MWPCSDTYPAEEMFSYYSSGPHTTTTHCPSNLLHRPYNTHLYRPPVQRGSLLQGGAVYGGGNRMSDLGAVHKFNQFVNPVQLQVEMLQREDWMLINLPGQNLGIPRGVLKYDEQMKLSRGLGGEYRGKGTGVFIPRTSTVTKNIGIAARTSTTRDQNLSSSSENFSVRVDEKELNAQFPPLAGARTKQEKNQVHSHKNSGKRFDTRKEAECHYQLPPELALPQEWTY